MNIQLSLITNYDKDRYPYIKEKLDELAFYLRAKDNTVLLNVPDHRPVMIPAGAQDTARQIIAYWKLNREWCQYRKISKPPLIQDTAGLILTLLRDSGNESRQRRAFRDFTVQINHVIAWKAATDFGADFLIVFEDDAVFKPDSMARLYSMILSIPELENKGYVFIDLADGLPKVNLEIDKLEEGISTTGGYTYYRKPVTNTACRYLMNRNMAAFVTETMLHGTDRAYELYGADWLLNAIFMRLEPLNKLTLCMHADPPVFEHGSMTGKYGAL